MIKRLALFALTLSVSSLAIASNDPVKDTRVIMAGTVTTAVTKKAYLSGARDGTAAFKGALAAYKAVTAAAASTPDPVTPLPPADSWTQCAMEGEMCKVIATGKVRFGNVTNFVEKVTTGPIACTNAAFGRDPTPGFEKTCSTNSDFGTPTLPPVTIPVVVAPPAPVTPLPTDGWVKTGNIRAGGYVQLIKNCPAFKPDENAGVIGGIYSVVAWGWTPTLSDQVQPPKVLPEGGNIWTIKAGNGGFIYQYESCLTGVTQAAMPG